MLLSHQSSLIECDPYYSNFLETTYNAKTGSEVPNIKQILLPGGKFYNQCLFSATYAPGTYYRYVNLNFGVAGTIVEIVSKQRYDQYTAANILNLLSEKLPENATFNPATIANANNLGVLYLGSNGKWVPDCDNYNGVIPARNLTGYKIGDNGVIFGPQGSMRASVSHLNNYMITLANKGVTKEGKTLLKPSSVAELLRPRYNYHGPGGGVENDFHLYSLGLYTTSYRTTDTIIPHQVVRGHTGSAYGLISAHYFWGQYTFAYIVNGALNGYKYGTGTIYEYERLAICSAVDRYIKSIATKNISVQ